MTFEKTSVLYRADARELESGTDLVRTDVVWCLRITSVRCRGRLRDDEGDPLGSPSREAALSLAS